MPAYSLLNYYERGRLPWSTIDGILLAYLMDKAEHVIKPPTRSIKNIK